MIQPGKINQDHQEFIIKLPNGHTAYLEGDSGRGPHRLDFVGMGDEKDRPSREDLSLMMPYAASFDNFETLCVEYGAEDLVRPALVLLIGVGKERALAIIKAANLVIADYDSLTTVERKQFREVSLLVDAKCSAGTLADATSWLRANCECLTVFVVDEKSYTILRA